MKLFLACLFICQSVFAADEGRDNIFMPRESEETVKTETEPASGQVEIDLSGVKLDDQSAKKMKEVSDELDRRPIDSIEGTQAGEVYSTLRTDIDYYYDLTNLNLDILSLRKALVRTDIVRQYAGPDGSIISAKNLSLSIEALYHVALFYGGRNALAHMPFVGTITFKKGTDGKIRRVGTGGLFRSLLGMSVDAYLVYRLANDFYTSSKQTLYLKDEQIRELIEALEVRKDEIINKHAQLERAKNAGAK